MIPNPSIEIQTSPVARSSVPAWFAEVVIIAQHLMAKGLLDAFAHQVPLVRGRFSRYEPLDYLALLVGYAISGERTLAEFFERLAPFAEAFMALFGRSTLPHRSSLSRFLAAVDRPCLEAFCTLFQQEAFTDGWTGKQIVGLWDRQGQRCARHKRCHPGCGAGRPSVDARRVWRVGATGPAPPIPGWRDR